MSKKSEDQPLSLNQLHGQNQRAEIARLYRSTGGNISAIARDMGLARSTVREHIRKMGGAKKPIASGSVKATKPDARPLPAKGKINRYLLTSAQNNTYVNEYVWGNLQALAAHYKAEILVGTYSYNQNAYGELSVKRGTKKSAERTLWYDQALLPFIADSDIELANGLVWCGSMNILPTAEDPLSGLETYSHRKSAIFPHAKLAMRSIATMRGEGTKLNYTTGTVTQHNYLQKKAGLKAEHHHSYAALIVEVNSKGNWWVRQIVAEPYGKMQDLDVAVDKGKVTTGNSIEAITWGDLHATIIDKDIQKLSMDMLDTLKPKVQFVHDLVEGVSFNHHESKNPHALFEAYLRGYSEVSDELKDTAKTLKEYLRPNVKTVVVDSNHDNWLKRWLQEHDYRKDPRNAMLFLEAQLETYRQMKGLNKNFHLVEWAMRKFGCPEDVQFLRVDESFTICDKRIECGQHGHLGPNGARGNPNNLSKVGRRANTAHTHSAGIYAGLYVAGTSSQLDWSYTKGPSSWTHSHILTYPNGARTILTCYANRWRA